MSSLLESDETAVQVSAGEPYATQNRNRRTERSFSTVTDHSGLKLTWRAGEPVLHAGRSGVQVALKRVFDIILSALALTALLPLFAAIAVAIKLTSRGPVFFVQEREGLGGKTFGVFKFRTMRTEEGDPSGVKQTLVGDSRITQIGRFLRRTSIDELPQLINVLVGHMSLVGPRPHVPGMLANGVPYAQLVPYYNLRHEVLPGITGWAQANGLRGTTVSVDLAIMRIEHDLAYIQNVSLLLDVAILFRTVRREFLTGTGH